MKISNLVRVNAPCGTRGMGVVIDDLGFDFFMVLVNEESVMIDKCWLTVVYASR